MSKITTIGNVIIAIAADKNDDLGKVLRQLPSIQKELLKREIISIDDLSNEQIEVLMEEVYQEEFAGKEPESIQNLSKDANLEDWIDGPYDIFAGYWHLTYIVLRLVSILKQGT